jgi:hypothetical protein
MMENIPVEQRSCLTCKYAKTLAVDKPCSNCGPGWSEYKLAEEFKNIPPAENGVEMW